MEGGGNSVRQARGTWGVGWVQKVGGCCGGSRGRGQEQLAQGRALDKWSWRLEAGLPPRILPCMHSSRQSPQEKTLGLQNGEDSEHGLQPSEQVCTGYRQGVVRTGGSPPEHQEGPRVETSPAPPACVPLSPLFLVRKQVEACPPPPQARNQ